MNTSTFNPEASRIDQRLRETWNFAHDVAEGLNENRLCLNIAILSIIGKIVSADQVDRTQDMEPLDPNIKHTVTFSFDRTTDTQIWRRSVVHKKEALREEEVTIRPHRPKSFIVR